MKAVVDFIGRLGKVLDAAGLAAEGHTDLVIAIEDAAFKALHHLLDQESKPVFNFVDGDVIFANQRVRRLSAWKWTTHLTRAGVERIEISQGVARKEFGDFLTVLLARLYPATGGATDESVPTPDAEFSHVRFGQLDAGEQGWSGEEGPGSPRWLQEEAEATGWLLGQAARGEKISGSLTLAVVQSLSVALHQEQSVLRLLVPLKAPDERSLTCDGFGRGAWILRRRRHGGRRGSNPARRGPDARPG